MSDAVSSAMRTLSLEPLMDGVPAHCAMGGILALFYSIQSALVVKVQPFGMRSRALQVLGDWNVALGDNAR